MDKREKTIALWKGQIRVYERIIKALERAKSFGDQFDEKVINARFTKALNEGVDEFYSVEVYHDVKMLNINLFNSFVNLDGETCRVKYYWSNVSPVERDYIDKETGRLNKEYFCQAINKEIDRIEAEIDMYDKSIRNFDLYIRTVENLNMYIGRIGEQIPPTFRFSGCAKIELNYGI